jgi:two-component system sensor histidine kinase UhpB
VDHTRRLLMLEDVPEEAELVQRELQKGGMTFVSRRVQSREEFIAAMDDFAPDLILADSKLPAFDGRTALELARQHVPPIPVIMVTGELGDEAAVDLLIAGASDYVLKDRLARLASAVHRVLLAEDERRNRERLERAVRDATEEERRRLAKELHDGLGQELTCLAMLAEGLLMQVTDGASPDSPDLERLALIARDATRTCRQIAHGMSPLGGARGLPEALRGLAARLCGPPGPEVSVVADLDQSACLSREASEQLYRIAQEALTNAIKHSGADIVQMRLDVSAGTVRLRVLDNGRGPQGGLNIRPGLGFGTMRDRAESIGGRLTILAREDRSGTAVVCEVPVSGISSVPRSVPAAR